VDIAQNSIQIGYGATGTVENNTVGDDVFNGDPSAGTGSGILVYDSGNLSITGNSVAFTQGGIVIATDGNQTDNDNTLTNNQVVNTQVGDGIDLCSNGNTVTSNTVFSASQSGIHLDSSCVAASIVSKNVVNDACAGILLGSGTGNTFPTANTYANVANTTLAGDTCTPVIVPEALVKNTVSSAGHNSAPARP
jgi:parallel beta-helix repeat protein